MPPNQCSDDLALAQLRTDFGGHRIWRRVRADGQLGDWVASLHDPAAGVEPTVIRSDSSSLRLALVAEKRRAAERKGAR